MKNTITQTLSTFIFLMSASVTFGQQLPWIYNRGQGSDHLSKNKYVKAVQSFNECLKDNAQADDCYSGRGSAYLALGKTSVAQADFDQAIKLNPKNKEAVEALAKLKSLDAVPRIKMDDVSKSRKDAENAVKVFAAGSNVVIAGQGWGKIVLGASKSDIEKILGKSDLEADYLSFHQKSGIYVYFSYDKLAKEISFETSIGKYTNNFKGQPDKKLKWGASSAEVIKVYGNSYKKRPKDSEYGGVMLNSIIYSNAEFYFAADKLVRINVFDGNDRLKSFAISEEVNTSKTKTEKEWQAICQPYWSKMYDALKKKDVDSAKKIYAEFNAETKGANNSIAVKVQLNSLLHDMFFSQIPQLTDFVESELKRLKYTEKEKEEVKRDNSKGFYV